MKNHAPMTRRQFLKAMGVAALSVAVVRIETLQSSLRAVVPDDAPSSGGYGQSAYGA